MSTAQALGIPIWTRGDRMRKAMDSRGFKVADAAREFRVHRNTISHWLHDHHAPSPTELREWAVWTRVPLEWLETGRSGGPRDPDGLPHLDSNQEPTGYTVGRSRFDQRTSGLLVAA